MMQRTENNTEYNRAKLGILFYLNKEKNEMGKQKKAE